jgi:hypothetical protein
MSGNHHPLPQLLETVARPFLTLLRQEHVHSFRRAYVRDGSDRVLVRVLPAVCVCLTSLSLFATVSLLNMLAFLSRGSYLLGYL